MANAGGLGSLGGVACGPIIVPGPFSQSLHPVQIPAVAPLGVVSDDNRLAGRDGVADPVRGGLGSLRTGLVPLCLGVECGGPATHPLCPVGLHLSGGPVGVVDIDGDGEPGRHKGGADEFDGLSAR